MTKKQVTTLNDFCLFTSVNLSTRLIRALLYFILFFFHAITNIQKRHDVMNINNACHNICMIFFFLKKYSRETFLPIDQETESNDNGLLLD
jgi:hypothetical protein